MTIDPDPYRPMNDTVDDEPFPDECPIHEQYAEESTVVTGSVTSGFARGDKVRAKGWGDLVFTVQGHLAGPGISRLVEIKSPGGITGAVPADELWKVAK